MFFQTQVTPIGATELNPNNWSNPVYAGSYQEAVTFSLEKNQEAKELLLQDNKCKVYVVKERDLAVHQAEKTDCILHSFILSTDD